VSPSVDGVVEVWAKTPKADAPTSAAARNSFFMLVLLQVVEILVGNPSGDVWFLGHRLERKRHVDAR